MFEICLSCAAAEALVGITLTDLLAVTLGHMLLVAYEHSIGEVSRQLFSNH
jgi:hypothetical protein